MKIIIRLTSILFFFSIVSTAFSQVDPSMVVGLGKTVFGGIKDRKKGKYIEASISETQINGNKIKILRVPEEKVISNAKGFILKVQNKLEEYHQQYSNGETIPDLQFNSTIQTDIWDIKAYDNDWPISYYDTELKEYKAYTARMTKIEKAKKDSLENVTRVARQRETDSIRIVRQKFEDSIVYAQRVNGYQFVNREFVILKEKPSEKSQTVGKLYLGSYVRLTSYGEGSDYVKIALDGVEGFVRKSELVDNLDKITTPGADISMYKSRRYYKYEPNYNYTPSTMSLYTRNLYSLSSCCWKLRYCYPLAALSCHSY